MAAEYYELQSILAEYLLFHYGTEKEILPEEEILGGPNSASLFFPRRSVTETFNLGIERGRALDLGCAVGAASFELCRHFREVIGIDRSAAFVRSASILKEQGRVEYQRVDQGSRTTSLIASVSENIDRSRVKFMEGDALNLPEFPEKFDAVLLANLIDRLPDPKLCLKQMPDIVASGGQLVITSPYTWREEFTPKENWLGQKGSVVEELEALLQPAFSLEKTVNLPFLIREHARKFQWSIAQGSVWRRNSSI